MEIFNPRKNKVLGETLNNIARFFPYFFGFYIISVFLFFPFPRLQPYFNWNWPAFHFSIICFGILGFFSPAFQDFLRQAQGKPLAKEIFFRALQIFNISIFLRIVSLIAVLLIGLVWLSDPLTFLALGFGAASVIYKLNSRYASALSLLALLDALVFTGLGHSDWAAQTAVYSFYLLIASALTQVRESDILRLSKDR